MIIHDLNLDNDFTDNDEIWISRKTAIFNRELDKLDIDIAALSETRMS